MKFRLWYFSYNWHNIVYSAEISGFFISSYIWLYFLNALFTETNSSWLIHESIKVLEIRTSIEFNVSFHNNTISSCFFFFLFIIDLYFLILAMIAQIFIPTAVLVIPTGTQNIEANIEIETQPVTVETKIWNFSI